MPDKGDSVVDLRRNCDELRSCDRLSWRHHGYVWSRDRLSVQTADGVSLVLDLWPSVFVV